MRWFNSSMIIQTVPLINPWVIRKSIKIAETPYDP